MEMDLNRDDLSQSSDENASLGYAVTLGDLLGVESALSDRANANTFIPYVFPPYWGGKLENVPVLIVAIYHRYTTIVDILLKKGKADVEEKGDCYLPPLAVAARKGHTHIVRKLIDYGANINSKDSKYGESPIHAAVRNGHSSTAQLLNEKGGHLDDVNNAGETPLHTAAYYGRRSMLSWLLKNGVTPTSTNNKGSTAADCAESRGHNALATWLRTGLHKQEGKKEIDDKQLQCEISLYTRPVERGPVISRSLATHWALSFYWADGYKTSIEAFGNDDDILDPVCYDGDVDHRYTDTWSKTGSYPARECSSLEVLDYAEKLGGEDYHIITNNCQSFATDLALKFGVKLPRSASRIVSLTSRSSIRNKKKLI